MSTQNFPVTYSDRYFSALGTLCIACIAASGIALILMRDLSAFPFALMLGIISLFVSLVFNLLYFIPVKPAWIRLLLPGILNTAFISSLIYAMPFQVIIFLEALTLINLVKGYLLYRKLAKKDQ